MMEVMNRHKIMFLEKKHIGKWLAEQLGKNPSTVYNMWCGNVPTIDFWGDYDIIGNWSVK